MLLYGGRWAHHYIPTRLSIFVVQLRISPTELSDPKSGAWPAWDDAFLPGLEKSQIIDNGLTIDFIGC